ncbi:fluoride efflux transporter FluC [Marinicellulosiphila megalodicopiae]|uniref:fluoride efflux transporter FluC n=1 Tax=Marinicellulosiphila megalodicopiae TaxID=2724896 RepID=UPI003BAF5D8A
MNFQILAIALGGATGALARYGVGTLVHKTWMPFGVYTGTFIANSLGCFIMGLAFVYFDLKYSALTSSNEALVAIRQFCMIGFLGAFTTYSSFSLDAFKMLQQGQIFHWGIYIFSTLIVSIVSLMIGVFIAKFLLT